MEMEKDIGWSYRRSDADGDTNDAGVIEKEEKERDGQDLAEKSQSGDHRGLIDIYIERYPSLLEIAFMIMKEDEAASDVMQNVAVSILKEQNRQRNIDNPYAFFKKCILNAAISYIRKESKANLRPIPLLLWKPVTTKTPMLLWTILSWREADWLELKTIYSITDEDIGVMLMTEYQTSDALAVNMIQEWGSEVNSSTHVKGATFQKAIIMDGKELYHVIDPIDGTFSGTAVLDDSLLDIGAEKGVDVEALIDLLKG